MPGVVMTQRVRFEHKVLTSGQHAILSPDVLGFCVVGAPGESRWEVESHAWDARKILQARDASIPQGLPNIGAEHL